MGELATRKLTERQGAFVRHMALTGDIPASALHAKIDVHHGYELARLPHVLAEIHQSVRKKLISAAPMALKTIIDIAKDDQAPGKLRLDASWKLLQMAGHVAPRAAAEKPTDQPLHEMTTDQLRELAGRLEDEIAGRAKPIVAPVAAPADAQAVDMIG